MKKKLIYVLSITLLATTVFIGCGKSNNGGVAENNQQNLKSDQTQIFEATDESKNPDKAKERKDTFIAAISSPGGVFLPFFYENGWDGNATSPIFDSLVDRDLEGKPTGRLAEKWSVSSNELVYTFNIRKDAKFSDGTPVTADDVAFTLTLLHDPAYEGGSDISLSFIKGGEDYKKGNATEVSGIKVIDKQTIEITTEQVNAQNLFYLGGTVLSKNYYGKDYKKGKIEYLKDLYSKPMGAGPYKFVNYVPGQEIAYVANENFYGGKPNVEKLIYKVTSKDTNFQLFQNGEIDYDGFTASDESVEQLKSLGFANVRVGTTNTYSFLYVNNKKEYLKDTAVRQALIYGLDREKVVKVRFKGYGQVANVAASPLSWAYSEEGVNKYEFDVDKAKQLLEDAGWKVNADGIREKDGVKLKLSYLTRKGDEDFITIAKENYKDIGVELDAELMDFNALVSRLTKGDYDLAAVRTSMLSDPDDSVAEFASTNQGNYSGYSNSKVDDLLKQSISSTDIKKRTEVYKELYKELSNDPPIILLSYSKGVSAYNSRLENFEISSYTGISSGLNKVKIKE